MPKLHEYVDGKGYYIRSAFKGKIVTYKVTPSGIKYLKGKRYKDGSDISPRMLDKMRKKKFIYTGGSGPGELEDWEFASNRTTYPYQSSSATSFKPNLQNKSRLSKKPKVKRSACSAQTIIIILIIIALVVICSQCS